MPEGNENLSPLQMLARMPRAVEWLLNRNEELEDLCGEILATLDLNLEKRYLRGCSPQATADMEELVTKWNARFRETKVTP